MILAVDTSSENCSVALSLADGVIDVISEHTPRSHTQLALPMVKEILQRNTQKLSNVSAIAFGKGPGSFTGIRIAAGIAQGLAFGAEKPIYAISNLEAMALQAYHAYGQTKVMVALDARMNEVYWGLYEIQLQEDRSVHAVVSLNGEAVCKPENLLLARGDLNAEKFMGVGSGFEFYERFPEALKGMVNEYHKNVLPEAKAICELAKIKFEKGEEGRLQDALPSYVRDTVTWKKLPGRE